MQRCAIVVGAGGQDGHYLCRELTTRGDRVVRVGRNGVYGDMSKRPFDVLNVDAVSTLVREVLPDEIYYLAAHHHSSQEGTGSLRALLDESYEIHCVGLQNCLNAMSVGRREARLFYAAFSLIFIGTPAAAHTQ